MYYHHTPFAYMVVINKVLFFLKILTKFDFKYFNKLTNVRIVVLRMSKQKQIKTRFK